MYQYLVPGNKIRLADRTIRNSGTYHDQQIRFVHGTVRVCLTVIAHHSVIERMLGRHDTDPHHGGYYGNAMSFGEAAQLFLGLTK